MLQVPHGFMPYTETGVSKLVNQTRLDMFAELKEGWAEGYAYPIDKQAIADAREFINLFDNEWQPEIFPLQNGGIQCEWNIGEIYIEFEIRGEHEYYLLYESEDGDVMFDAPFDKSLEDAADTIDALFIEYA